MICRSSIKCETCGQNTIVRIGMGQGKRQEHSAPCPNCKESMRFGLNVDYEKYNWEVFCLDNCTMSVEEAGDPAIYVDANFIVPAGDENNAYAFPRIFQMQEHMDALISNGGLATRPAMDPGSQARKDFQAEWLKIKRSISLSGNGKHNLAADLRKAATQEIYKGDTVASNADWLYRFSIRLFSPVCAPVFEGVVGQVEYISENFETTDLETYLADRSNDRLRRYLEIIEQFFDAFDDFSQTLFRCRSGLRQPDGYVVTSERFEKTKTFYGDAFEVFASSVEFLVVLNNLRSGRAYDQLKSIDLKKYNQLDNASKFNPLVLNFSFMSLCIEKDNQIRNASHHKGIKMERETGLVQYRAGRGGMGDLMEISYVSYLYRSTRLFFQILVVLCAELRFYEAKGITSPIK